MKKSLKNIIVSILVVALLLSFAYAGNGKVTIEVLMNSINLMVNGAKVDADTIIYDGVTYVPLRVAAEMLGKEVGWDPGTQTASINDKKINADTTDDKETAKESGYAIIDNNGKVLYSFRINKVTTMSERNRYSDKNPAQVLLIDYTYKNIANPEEVFLSDINFKAIDSKGKIGYTYPNSIINYPQRIPIGVTCDAQMIFGLDNESERVILNFYENMFGEMTKSFEIPVE